MRRFGVLVSVIAVMLLGVLALHAQPVAVAQEASPAAGEMMEPEGVTFEPLAITSGLTLPSPADMIAARFTVDPGAQFPLEASDPSGGMLIVQSGTCTVRLDTAWAVSRSGSLNAAIGTAEATGTFTPSEEQVASGEEATLDAGDAAYIPGSVGGEIRNDGQEPAVGLVVLVGPTEGMMGGATPTP
jgi:quercetin dioxygenase-like cupin family protein